MDDFFYKNYTLIFDGKSGKSGKIFSNLIPLKNEILIHKKVFHFQRASESASIIIPAWSAVVRMIHGYCVVYKHFSLNERLQNMGALMITHKFNDTDTNKLKQKL